MFMLPALVLLLVLMPLRVLMLLPARRFIRNLHNDKDAPSVAMRKRLNIKLFGWDNSSPHGVDGDRGQDPDWRNGLVPALNTTVYPMPIGLGATFDLGIIEDVSRRTAVEARVLHKLYYEASNGTFISGTNFDYGRLANLAYDPRVGRTSEMYSECPFLASEVGVVAIRALQNRTAEGFLQTAQSTPMFITDHASNNDNLVSTSAPAPVFLALTPPSLLRSRTSRARFNGLRTRTSSRSKRFNPRSAETPRASCSVQDR